MKHTNSVRHVSFDIMSCGKYICTLRMPYPPQSKVSLKRLVEYAYSKRPSVRYMKDVELYVDYF